MPTISEPLTDLRNQSASRFRELFIAGKIGEDTYRVSLKSLRLSDNDIMSEIRLALMDKRITSRTKRSNPIGVG